MRNRLKELLWGPPEKLGRTRQALVKSILSLAILGGTAIWAQPKIDAWLNPPLPMEQGECTKRPIILSGMVPYGDITAARAWVRTDAKIPNNRAVFVWNGELKRPEFLMTDGEYFWIIEVVCFAIRTPGETYVAKFGEFEKITIKEFLALEEERDAAEKGIIP